MKYVLIVAVVSVISGCAGLMPKEERTVQFIETTNATKADAFNRASVLLAKRFSDSNSAIKLRDESAGQIIAKGRIECPVLKSWGDVNSYYADFDLDFQAKDKKIRTTFEDVQIKGVMVRGGPIEPMGPNQISSKENLEKVKVECLKPVHGELVKAIGANSDF